MRTAAGSLARWAPTALAPVAIFYGLAAVGVAARHGELTTYAARSAAAAVAELAAGWALIAAGLVTCARRPGRRAGPLAVAAGFAWFAADWIGWQAGPGAVRVLALAAQGVTAAAVTQLALGVPTGSPSSAAARALVAATWTLTAVVGIGRVLFYDPLVDPSCAAYCAANPLLLHGEGSLARALDWLDLGLAWLMAGGVVAFGARRLARGGAVVRRRLSPTMVPSALFLSAWAARATSVAPGDDPAREILSASFNGRAAALGALAAALGWALTRASRSAMAVRRLARGPDVAGAGDSVEAALRRGTGDSSLRVAFPLAGAERWIDADGDPVDPPQRSADRAVTAILRAGHPVAAVLHDPGILDGPVLEREIGAAAQLAVDNERLRAEARLQLRELKASRARIVEAGDAERRRLERDLHDGAQQQLVSLSLALRMARSASDAVSDLPAAARLEEAAAALQEAIAELRELAHGIHPVELTDEGLAAAIATLADRAPLPVRIAAVPAERLPAPVETAAYVLVDEAVRRAARRRDGATLRVDARRANGRFVLEFHDPGERSPDRALADLLGMADRVGALDGRLSVEPASPRGVRIRAELPCA